MTRAVWKLVFVTTSASFLSFLVYYTVCTIHRFVCQEHAQSNIMIWTSRQPNKNNVFVCLSPLFVKTHNGQGKIQPITITIYTAFKVDGSALFQSARIDGADFLNFDTRKGRDIHPPYFCGPRHLCQNVLPMCFRVAPSMQGGKGKEKGKGKGERGQGRGKGKGKGGREGERRGQEKGKGTGNWIFLRETITVDCAIYIGYHCVPFVLSPFSFLLSLLLALSLYKWNASVTYRWRNPQSWFHEEKSCSLSLSLSPFSFPSSFHCPFPFLLFPSPFPRPFPFLLSPFPLSAFCFRFLSPFPFPFSFPFPLSFSPFLLSPFSCNWMALSQVVAPSI